MTWTQAIPLLVVFVAVIGIAVWGISIAAKPGLTPEEQDRLIKGE
ncbi:hypothetical protein [Paucibacter sp. KCTC 42545]|nr:hypothetical protein [Paucibacter sp. KCTC 42545]